MASGSAGGLTRQPRRIPPRREPSSEQAGDGSLPDRRTALGGACRNAREWVMDLTHHDLKDLFEQLGLPSAPAEIDAFIAQHRPLADDVLLPDAPFWSEAQAQFLREEFDEDADWAEMVDQLNIRLRA